MKSLLILFFSMMLLLFGCQKSDSDLLNNNRTAISAKDEICCSVQCRRGNCSTTKTPCTCQCIGGQPSCSGGSISIDSDQSSNYAPVIQYLQGQGSWQADSAANVLQRMYDLVVIDNNGMIDDSIDIVRYESYFTDWANLFENHLPQAIADSIEQM